ncbi:MAG: hypothetical protein J6M02_02020 [Clostridia bacterium]|nr:hypothetical protein [Clostridia bacterium]
MIEDDTIQLLKECNAGVKMGVASIDEVLPHVKNDTLRQRLVDCKTEHENLGEETKNLLNQYHDSGKEPNPFASMMSSMKTNTKLLAAPTDETISDLITDGCNMGVKSLNRYLNEYEAAEEKAKDITKRLINLEEKLAIDIRNYL